jgi:hypothetical protein
MEIYVDSDYHQDYETPRRPNWFVFIVFGSTFEVHPFIGIMIRFDRTSAWRPGL